MDVPLDLTSYVRVLKMASTPGWDEFSQVAKIAGAGILVVGLAWAWRKGAVSWVKSPRAERQRIE